MTYTLEDGETIQVDFLFNPKRIYRCYGRDGGVYSEKYNDTNKIEDIRIEYKGHTINFMDFNKLSMGDIQSMIELGKEITDSDLALAIICEGVSNIRFHGPMYEPDVFIGRFAICFNPTIHDIDISLTNDWNIHRLYGVELVKSEDNNLDLMISPLNLSIDELISRLVDGEYTIVPKNTPTSELYTNSHEYFSRVYGEV